MMKVTPNKGPDCSFVKLVPLPIPTQKGVPIQARVLSAKPGQTETVYNARTPTRGEIREENYRRRLMQWTQQGFRALNYKPYQGIGDPFYLDQKKLILHALGQWDENQVETEEPASSSDEEGGRTSPVSKPITPAKFVLRRKNKEINTLPKEINRGRYMVRNVKLGHNLFVKLRNDHQEKMTKDAREQQQKLDLRRTQWQPPSYGSSSSEDEDDDEDLREEVDLKSYMQSEDARTTSPTTEMVEQAEGTQSRVVFSVLDKDIPETAPSRVKSAPGSTRSRKKSAKYSRPYTPQHVNICTRYPDHRNTSQSKDEVIQAESLFKQLCVLNWLLEAMDINPPVVMGPILTSWDLKEIGGRKTTTKKVQKEKLDKEKWEQFLFKDMASKAKSRKISQPRASRLSPSRRFSRKSSIQIGSGLSHKSIAHQGSNEDASSVILDNEDSSTGGSIKGGTRPSSVASMVDDSNLQVNKIKDSISIIVEDEEDVPVATSPDRGSDKESADKSKFPEFESYFKDVKDSTAKLDKNLKKELQRVKVTKQLDNLIREEEIQDRRELLEKRSGENKNMLKKLRADLHLIRSKSSPGVVEFQNNAKSIERASMAGNLRQMFGEVKEENALLLHDKLEINDRQKLRRCKQKFNAMVTEGFSFHRAIDKMRSVIEEERKRMEVMQKKTTEEYEEWLTDIEVNIPAQLQELWYYDEIISKLRRFGQVESAKQSTTIKFLTVLGKLRQWEICSPDVSAAVEFCRDRIIEMPVPDYEEWFNHAFPQVMRPKTAPPSVGSRGRRS